MRRPRVHCFTVFSLLALALAGGCGYDESKSFVRLHLENGSDASLTFLAIEVSEQATETAENRLLEPLAPGAVYSAFLSRPGNYWVRTKFESEGHVIERIEGPLRITQGVSYWQFAKVDARPLYPVQEQIPVMNYNSAILTLAAAAHTAAGRISFSSN